MSEQASNTTKRRTLRGVKGLGSGSKRAGTFQSSGFKEIGNALERGSTRREFDTLEYIPVASIRLDQGQPRRLGMKIDWLKEPDTAPEGKRELIDGILALAGSMSTEQYTPIDVYHDGVSYGLIAGERRYWAARLNGHESIFAKVLASKPENLRLRQLVENVAREELSTSEMLDALLDVLQEARELEAPISTAKELGSKVGMRESTSYRWWAVLHAGETIHQAVRNGMPLSEAYAASAQASPKPQRRKGSDQSQRPAVSLTLTVVEPAKAQLLYEKLGGAGSGEVAWDDPGEAKKAILAQIETLLSQG